MAFSKIKESLVGLRTSLQEYKKFLPSPQATFSCRNSTEGTVAILQLGPGDLEFRWITRPQRPVSQEVMAASESRQWHQTLLEIMPLSSLHPSNLKAVPDLELVTLD